MDTLFFLLSKVAGTLLKPDAIVILALLACCVLLYRNHARIARYLLIFITVILIVVGYLPIGQWMYSPLEHRFPANPALPATVDGVIMLGGDLNPELSAYWQQPELSDSSEREIAFAALARQFPSAKLVMAGGSGSVLNNEFKEADFVPLFLRLLQMDPARVIYENGSRNTWENALNSKPLVQPQPGEHWVLVTSAGHMPRAVGVFCQLGWPVQPWPIDHITAPEAMHIGFDLLGHMQDINTALHEWLGLTAYYATGKIPALFPGQCAPQSEN